MEYFRINADNPQLKAIEKAVDILRAGGIIVFPTDLRFLRDKLSRPTASSIQPLFWASSINSLSSAALMVACPIQRILRGISSLSNSLAREGLANILSSMKKQFFAPRLLISLITSEIGRGLYRLPENLVTEQKSHEWGHPLAV